MSATDGHSYESIIKHWIVMHHTLVLGQKSYAQEGFLSSTRAEWDPTCEVTLGFNKKDQQRLVKAGGRTKRVLISWTSGGEKYLPMALNLGESVRRNAPDVLRHLVFVAMDREALHDLRRGGFKAVRYRIGASVEDDIWKMRWRILVTACGLGLGTLVIDTDMVVLRNPFAALRQDANMEVMTDHFFPEKFLFVDWVRVEDHINTGFLWGNDTRTAAFISSFLQYNCHEQIGGAPRHKIDQNVFNRYVLSALRSGHTRAYYESNHFGEPSASFSIRISNPAVVSHGMNYFWRKAHLLQSPPLQPVVVHANGVDAKEYFLRDRQLWYLDDWDSRWRKEGGGRFLTYHHPRGLTLSGDFEHIVAALLVAYYSQRRLVLPRTMNCANCPAYEAYGLNMTMAGSDCTYDYFAWSQPLFGYLGGLIVESSIVDSPRFKQLHGQDSTSPCMLASSLRGPSSVAHVDNVMIIKEQLIEAGRLKEDDLFQCSHMQFGWAWMACRDDSYVQRSGRPACSPSFDQEGCGFRPLNCCENYWGWGEKLEYYTGVAWNLPCNCGLKLCAPTGTSFNQTTAQVLQGAEGVPRLGGSDRRCCKSVSVNDVNTVPACVSVPLFEDLPTSNVGKDLHEYTGGLLRPFADSDIGAAEAWRQCRLHRRLSHGDRLDAQSAAHCTRLLAKWLLHQGSFSRLEYWLDFMFPLRRMPPADEVPAAIVSTVNTSEVENVDVDWRLIAHDAAQLRYISTLSTSKVSVRRYASIFREGLQHRDAAPFFWAYKRATHVPELNWNHVDWNLTRLVGMKRAADNAEHLVYVDQALNGNLQEFLCSALAQTTIWFGITATGATARLLEGLHLIRPLMTIAQELTKLLNATLVDMVATRHDAQSKAQVLRLSEVGATCAVMLMLGNSSHSQGVHIVPSRSMFPSLVPFTPGRFILLLNATDVIVEPSQSSSDVFDKWRVDVTYFFSSRI